jgi:uncharacterized repeat protein (TIGR03837 family)
MQWDVFCQVVDNHGDLGVCWRLAADLAARGAAVRLWVDDAAALAWMAPRGAPGVSVRDWAAADSEPIVGDVVVEAFGCRLPDPFVARMARRATPPAWINLEYLSAEDYVERSHRLPSPQSNGLTKWFFYPGFTATTGGLLREPGLLQRQAGFDAAAWLAARGLQPRGGERVVSVFCYPDAPVPALLDLLGDRPTLLLATAGPASALVEAALGASMQRGVLRAVALPWLTQHDYDHLLWASDMNVARGEDSFVRAQWAARPFVWHIYPQQDGAHRAKLSAFLARFHQGAPADMARDTAALWQAWNEGRVPLPPLPAAAAWQAHCVTWRKQLLGEPDLVTQLLGFVSEKG